ALRVALSVVVGLAVWGLVASQAAMAANGPQTATFGCLGVSQYLNVPPGVTQITVQLAGAAGQGGTGSDVGKGGLGGALDGTLSVTPGQTLRVDVGCESGYGYPTGGGGGGGNGLANDGYNGGGATAIVDDNTTQVLMVAAGGGGAGGNGVLGPAYIGGN